MSEKGGSNASPFFRQKIQGLSGKRGSDTSDRFLFSVFGKKFRNQKNILAKPLYKPREMCYNDTEFGKAGAKWITSNASKKSKIRRK